MKPNHMIVQHVYHFGNKTLNVKEEALGVARTPVHYYVHPNGPKLNEYTLEEDRREFDSVEQMQTYVLARKQIQDTLAAYHTALSAAVEPDFCGVKDFQASVATMLSSLEHV